jgi:hypothetical protein
LIAIGTQRELYGAIGNHGNPWGTMDIHKNFYGPIWSHREHWEPWGAGESKKVRHFKYQALNALNPELSIKSTPRE